MGDNDRHDRPWGSVHDDMTRIHADKAPAPARPRDTRVDLPPLQAARRRRPAAMIVSGGLAAGLIAGVAVIADVRHMPTVAKPRETVAAAPVRAVVEPVAPSRALTNADADADAAPSAEPVRLAAIRVAPLADRPDDARRYAEDRDEDDDAPLSRGDVLAADRALRAAYDDAIEAGVDRGRLVAIRNRWARLSARDFDRPDRLVAAYAGMTDQLQSAAEGERY